MVTRLITLATTVPAALLLFATAGLAQDASGVKLRGNTNIDVHAKEVNTVAVGHGNTAVTNIGNVDQSGGGHKDVIVDVKNIENVVGGSNRKGCIGIGGSACQ